MNLGHHLTVRLQAFASYCMTHAEFKKKDTKRRNMKRGKINPIIIKTSFKNRVPTGKEGFVRPEEHAHHSHQRCEVFKHPTRTEQRQWTVV